MTIRLDARQDEVLTRLAATWGVSKNEAVARAIEAADRADSRSDQVAALAREAMTEWSETLHRLGTV